jgi:hypothetical protein
MIMLVALGWVVFLCVGWVARAHARNAARNAQPADVPLPIQGPALRWTALDDRQLARYLGQAAP